MVVLLAVEAPLRKENRSVLTKLAMLKNGMRKDDGEESWFVHVAAAAWELMLAAAVSSRGTCGGNDMAQLQGMERRDLHDWVAREQ